MRVVPDGVESKPIIFCMGATCAALRAFPNKTWRFMRTWAHVALPGPKRQRAGAVQDAGAKGDGLREREASWTAVALHRFSPQTWRLNLFQETKSRYDL
jgi:hypothetical protein